MAVSVYLAQCAFGQSSPTPTATPPTIDPTQLQGTLWNMLMESDFGGANSDVAIPANQWTFIGEAGGDNAVAVGGNYSFLFLGTIVVTGGSQDGTIRWRIFPAGWDPNVQPWYGSSPPLTVRAGETITIPAIGSYPITVNANTGGGFHVQVYSTVPMTIRGGGQGYNGTVGFGNGNPCTVFIGLLLPYHEH
jgi:hypothetical protein